MTGYTQFFVCDEPVIVEWTRGLVAGEEEEQEGAEASMAQVVTLEGVTHVETNLLAQCARGGSLDIEEAVDAAELLATVDDVEGPWVVEFDPAWLELISRMHVDSALVRRWVRAAAEYSGEEENEVAETLTADVARTLQQLSTAALEEGMGLYCCVYG